MTTGKYEYVSGSTTHKGNFKIYQGSGGGIYIVLGNRYTDLKKEQIDDLMIDVYSLEDFDHDMFIKYYNL